MVAVALHFAIPRNRSLERGLAGSSWSRGEGQDVGGGDATACHYVHGWRAIGAGPGQQVCQRSGRSRRWQLGWQGDDGSGWRWCSGERHGLSIEMNCQIQREKAI